MHSRLYTNLLNIHKLHNLATLLWAFYNGLKCLPIYTLQEQFTCIWQICIENSIQQCFNKVFESRDAILSAISHPKFKQKWVEGQVKKDPYK